MRLLFDESVTKRLRRYLPNHEIQTVVEMGWAGTKNGKLLALASQKFDALITVDKNMQFQQNLNSLPISIVVLSTQSNEIDFILPLVPKLEAVLNDLKPRSLTVVEL
jgi:predicted nuclease of predicted toxin-antitoxin system